MRWARLSSRMPLVALYISRWPTVCNGAVLPPPLGTRRLCRFMDRILLLWGRPPVCQSRSPHMGLVAFTTHEGEPPIQGLRLGVVACVCGAAVCVARERNGMNYSVNWISNPKLPLPSNPDLFFLPATLAYPLHWVLLTSCQRRGETKGMFGSPLVSWLKLVRLKSFSHP
jgi:hypothetical protein